MSSTLPTPEASAPDAPQATPSPAAQPAKPPRVPSCVLCQQRKVKCDRQYPCNNCLKSGAQCVPPTPRPRQARRHFPHRDVLERLQNSEKLLQQYETLLRQNNILAEPPRKDPAVGGSTASGEGDYDASSGQPEGQGSRSATGAPAKEYEVLNFWHAMSQKYRSVDEEEDSDSDSSLGSVHRDVVNRAWDYEFEGQDNTLLGLRKEPVDLATLHPEPAQIFMLWQLYLDNVNPLLKVIHHPSLQERIVKAASNIKSINPNLEALMFSIYCISIISLAAQDCLAMFGFSKQDLLTRYQFACQQALVRCGFLRSSDRHCLTALHIYLISIRPKTDPRSLSSMLGMATRVAQRMGIHLESVNSKYPALEAEMRRRLWWSLVLFDTRIGEMVDHKSMSLSATWDCRPPLNVNDADLGLAMQDPPAAVQGGPTEAIFAVVRSEMGDLLRHSRFYHAFSDPPAHSVAQPPPATAVVETDAIETALENKYLKFCNPENPVHFLTTWLARSQFAKFRLVEHYSKYPGGSMHQTDAQCDAALSYALDWMQCDAKLLSSPHIQRFFWLLHFHFPFPAYIAIVQDLKRRPLGKQAEKAWDTMNENYQARFVMGVPFGGPRYTDGGIPSRDGTSKGPEDGPLVRVFGKMVQQAWDARKAAFGAQGELLTPPTMVTDIKEKAAQFAQRIQAQKQAANPNSSQSPESLGMGMGMDDFQVPMATGFDNYNFFYGMTALDESPPAAMPEPNPNVTGQVPSDTKVDELTWATMDWVLDQWLG